MNRAFQNLIVVALMISGTQVWPRAQGTETGNGGGVVVCRNKTTDAIEKVELLDYYEARVIRNLKLDLGADTLSYDEKAQSVLSKMEKLTPIRAAKYRKLYNKFFSEAVMVPDANLDYIDDAASVVVPIGCKKEQASILRTPEFPEDARYIISQILWDKLDNNSKAGLILHEIIYQEALSLGETTSKTTRYFVGKITSTEMANYTKDKFDTVITASKFVAFDLFNTLVKKQINEDAVIYETDASSFYSDMELPDAVKFGKMILSRKFTIYYSKSPSRLAWVHGVKAYRDNMVSINNCGYCMISFTPNGGLSEFSGSPETTADVDFGQFKLKLTGLTYGFKLQFDENEFPISWNGLIESINPSIGYASAQLHSPEVSGDDKRPIISSLGVILRGSLWKPYLMPTPQGPMTFTSGGSYYDSNIYFEENGIVKRGQIQAGQHVRLEDGRIKSYLNPTIIEFNSDGSAKKVWTDPYVKPNPDYIVDGCDINDLSVIEGKIKPTLMGVIEDAKIEMKPGSFSIQRTKDFIFSNGDSYQNKTGLPTFAVTFTGKNGQFYSIELYPRSIYGNQSTGGISLNAAAVLKTERGPNGFVKRFCEHSFYAGYSDEIAVVEKDNNYKVFTTKDRYYFSSLIENR